MSSFLTKLKSRKKNKEEVPRPSKSPAEEAEQEVPEDSPPPPSPVRQPVQTQSIFSGLHLSSKVAQGEAPDSPYTHRTSLEGNAGGKQEEESGSEKEESSFSFLTEGEPQEEQKEVSPFDFMRQAEAQEFGTQPSEDEASHGLGGLPITTQPEAGETRDLVDTAQVNDVRQSHDMGQTEQEDQTSFSFLDKPLATEEDGQPPREDQKPSSLQQFPTKDQKPSSQPPREDPMKHQQPLREEQLCGVREDQPSQQPSSHEPIHPGTSSRSISGGKQAVGKSTSAGHSAGEKKKKRKAIRPGQGVGVASDGISKREVSAGSESTPAAVLDKNSKDRELGPVPGQEMKNELANVENGNMEAVPTSRDVVVEELVSLSGSGAEMASKEWVPTASGDRHGEIPIEDDITSAPSTTDDAALSPGKASSASHGKLAPADEEALTATGSESEGTGHNTPSSVPGNYAVQISSEESLAGLLQSYASGLRRLRNELCVLEEEHRKKVLKQMESIQAQTDRWCDEKLLREKEAKALAEEDYELAEMLSQQLDTKRMKPEQDLVSCGLIEIQEWIEECKKEKENEVSFQEEMKSRLDVLREEHNLSLEELQKEQSSLLAKEKMQVQALEGEVEREAGHIALDCSHLEKREQLLAEETSRRAAHFISKKERLVSELEDVESEIKQLEEKLLSLQNQKKGIIAEMLVEEEHIKTVEAEMFEEREQLKSERQSLQERQDKLALQQAVVDKKQQAVRDMEQKHVEQNSSLKQLSQEATAVCQEVGGALSQQKQMQHQVQQLLELIREGCKLLQPSQELLSCQGSVDVKTREVESQTQQILQAQNKLGQQRRSVRDLQARLLELQESKKAAVTGRRFKEAAQLAGESKALTQHLEEEQQDLEQAEQTMAAANKKLAHLSEELCGLKDELSRLQRREDEVHIEDLLQASSTLNSLEEVLQDTVWTGVLESWRRLYTLATESLHSKQGSNSKQETKFKTPPQDSNDMPQDVEAPPQHEGTHSADCEGSKSRLLEIEAEIEKACQKEDYDRAAELEEELQTLKSAS